MTLVNQTCLHLALVSLLASRLLIAHFCVHEPYEYKLTLVASCSLLFYSILFSLLLRIVRDSRCRLDEQAVLLCKQSVIWTLIIRITVYQFLHCLVVAASTPRVHFICPYVRVWFAFIQRSVRWIFSVCVHLRSNTRLLPLCSSDLHISIRSHWSPLSNLYILTRLTLHLYAL